MMKTGNRNAMIKFTMMKSKNSSSVETQSLAVTVPSSCMEICYYNKAL